MLVNTTKLCTLKTWAENWTRDGMEDGVAVVKTGCSVSFAHSLFDPENQKPVAKRVRNEYQIITIDGVKFVCKKSDLPKAKH